MAAGPVSRLGSFEPGDKTGLRLSPHLAPSTRPMVLLKSSMDHLMEGPDFRRFASEPHVDRLACICMLQFSAARPSILSPCQPASRLSAAAASKAAQPSSPLRCQSPSSASSMLPFTAAARSCLSSCRPTSPSMFAPSTLAVAWTPPPARALPSYRSVILSDREPS